MRLTYIKGLLHLLRARGTVLADLAVAAAAAQQLVEGEPSTACGRLGNECGLVVAPGTHAGWRRWHVRNCVAVSGKIKLGYQGGGYVVCGGASAVKLQLMYHFFGEAIVTGKG
jgi:hypothetical protein